MINPFKFIQSVKNEAFRISWPTGKETLTGAVMVVLLAIVAAIFFLILDQILKFLLNFTLTISF
jgi:preprotein translocase subunit SecE